MTESITGDAAENTMPSVAAPEIEFDHWSSKITYTPWHSWSKMRHECPVAHTASHGGYYVLTRYEDIFATALDPGTFSSDGEGEGVAVPPQEIRPLYPLELDPPQHTGYRSILNPWLAPRPVAAMEPWVRQLVREHIAALPHDEEFDVATRFTLAVPPMVAFRVLGFPEQDHADIARWIDEIAGTVEGRHSDAGPRLYQKLTEIVAGRRAGERTHDVLDAVVFGEIDSEALDDRQVMAVLILLLFGGLGTTSAAMGGMMLWLADHREDRQRLINEPGLLDTAVDEFVRWTTPVAHLGRTTTRDTEVHGCPIPAGSRVLLAYGSANRDETVFARPDEVILDRRPNRHTGFGVGPHRCVGSHLAKLQLRVTLQELLAAMPDFHVTDHSRIRWGKGETRIINALPLRAGRENS
jgi:cytochrome P450